MDKLLQVREFDMITENPSFKNDKKYKYIESSAFQDLINFIYKFSGDEENADALKFMSISYKSNIGKVITFKNYVGVIQIKNSLQIQILPKISFDDEDDYENKKTKKIFVKMLKSMKNFPSKVFNDASLKVERMNIYDIFISAYLQEVRDLVKYGIKSAYIEQENNLRFYKGKLLTTKHIKENIIHKERFYVSYDEFHPNRSENKLIKSTLLKLQKLTTSAENSKEIRQLLTAFEMVEPSTNYVKDFSQVQIDRNMKYYEMIMQWSKMFLMDKSFTSLSGENTSRSLLFRMEMLYESYVAQQIKKILSPNGWEVLVQDKRHYLFEKPRQFALKPDIVCKQGNRTIIMDAKWKSLINNERKNYGISQGDMYQMYAYSKKYNTSEIWLLYPLNDEMRGNSDIKFLSGDGTTVRLHFVDLARIQETFEELRDKLENTEM